MKKLVLILVTLAILASIAVAVVAALPDTPGANEMASNYKSHGQLGNGNVNQEFKGGFINPWDCPPKNGIPCVP